MLSELARIRRAQTSRFSIMGDLILKLGVTYIASHLPDHIKEDMAELVEIGCKDVLFAVQENHLITLQGAVKYGPDLAKKAGLKPQAVIWGFANTFGGGRISKAMLNDQSLWRIKADDSREPLACLNNPVLTDHLSKYTEQLFNAGFELIFVDEPTKQDCFCEHCRTSFESDFGGDLLNATGTEDYNKFLNQTTINYTKRACDAVKEVSSDLETACCLMHHDRECWIEAAKIENLDMLGTDPYWLVPICDISFAEALDCANEMKRICQTNGKKSQFWLNCWRIPKGSEEEIYTGGKQLAQIEFDSFFTWSYKAGLGTDEECANTNLAWQSVVRLYKEISGR